MHAHIYVYVYIYMRFQKERPWESALPTTPLITYVCRQPKACLNMTITQVSNNHKEVHETYTNTNTLKPVQKPI